MPRLWSWVWVMAGLWLATGQLFAQAVTLLPDSARSLPLKSGIEYSQITQSESFMFLGSLSPRQQLDSFAGLGTFRPTGPQGLNFGASNDNFLLRFRIRRSQQAPDFWLLTLLQPQFVYAACYLVNADGGVVVMQTNVFRQTGREYLHGSCAAWPITLPDTRPVTVYLLFIGGDVPRHYPLELNTTTGFQQLTTRHALCWGMYFGLMLALMLYNLIVFWSVRDWSYFFYGLLLLSHIFLQLKSSGYGAWLIWGNWPYFSPHAPVLVAGFTLFAGLAFGVLFLETRRFAPRLHAPMVVFAGQSLVLGLLLTMANVASHKYALGLHENYVIIGYFVLVSAAGAGLLQWAGPWLQPARIYLRALVWLCVANLVVVWLGEVLGPYSLLGIVSAGAALVLCTWVGVLVRQNGNPNGTFYLIAWGSLLASVLVYTLYMTGLWPYHVGLANAVAFGSACEALLLALALSSRISRTRREREQALRDLVEQLTLNYQQQQRLQTIRNDIARDLHDDIGSSLSSISILSQSARQLISLEPARAGLVLDSIGGTARQVLDTMGDLVWNINPVHDTPAGLVARLRYFGNELFADTETAFVLEADVQNLQINNLAENRRHLFLIGKEALINCAKYARATQVRLTFTQQRQFLRLCIDDNGCGFIPTAENRPLRGGNGLKNIGLRAEKLGGSLQIESAPSKGTRICVDIPVD